MDYLLIFILNMLNTYLFVNAISEFPLILIDMLDGDA